MYTVLGATGHTGRIVAEALLKAGKAVRAVGRDGYKLKGLADKGAESCIGSVENPDDMARCLMSAEAAYVLIPGNMKEADFRGYQKRIVAAVTTGLRESGVRFVVFLSSVGAEQPHGTGPVVGLHMFEESLQTLRGVNALAVRAGYFMENFLANIPLIKQAGINGGAIRSDLPIAMIHTRDIAEYAARRLLALDFTGLTHAELHGQRDVTMAEATAILGQAIGKPALQYVQFGYDQLVEGLVGAGLSRSMADDYSEMSRALNEGHMKFHDPRGPANTTPTSLEEFAKTFATVFNS